MKLTIQNKLYEVKDYHSHSNFKRAVYQVKECNSNNVFFMSDDELEEYLKES